LVRRYNGTIARPGYLKVGLDCSMFMQKKIFGFEAAAYKQAAAT
jgi:hypothetical protein